jgi:hypothetical protein
MSAYPLIFETTSIETALFKSGGMLLFNPVSSATLTALNEAAVLTLVMS